MPQVQAKLPPAEAIHRERCRRSFAYFADQHCQVLSETAGPSAAWIPFRLWPAQHEVARTFQEQRLVVALKARQLGLTWLALSYVLWRVLLHPIHLAMLFSRRDDEAQDLLARLRGMHDRLPPWLQAPKPFVQDNAHEWALASGSRVLAFPAVGGDSYTAGTVVIDEADLVPSLDELLRSTKPTVDAGGKLFLISRPDKSKPESAFKRIYRAARAGEFDWKALFLPWSARPDRDAAWFDAQRRDVLARTGALDDLHEQYPATEAEALAPRSLDKRLPAEWLQRCYRPAVPLGPDQLADSKLPALPQLLVFAAPVAGRRYVLGADPAEGNPTSDESALAVLDVDNGEEVASLAGRFEPATFGANLDAVGRWYNSAPVLVERNNHGHAVLLWLLEHGAGSYLLGHDGKVGWLTNTKGKALLYGTVGEALRDGGVSLHGLETFAQLAAVEGATLRAPAGQHDDRAMAFALAVEAREQLLRLARTRYYDGIVFPAEGAPPEDAEEAARAQAALDAQRGIFRVNIAGHTVEFDDRDPEWWQR
jgi:hypothetical protein